MMQLRPMLGNVPDDDYEDDDDDYDDDDDNEEASDDYEENYIVDDTVSPDVGECP